MSHGLLLLQLLLPGAALSVRHAVNQTDVGGGHRRGGGGGGGGGLGGVGERGGARGVQTHVIVLAVGGGRAVAAGCVRGRASIRGLRLGGDGKLGPQSALNELLVEGANQPPLQPFVLCLWAGLRSCGWGAQHGPRGRGLCAQVERACRTGVGTRTDG